MFQLYSEDKKKTKKKKSGSSAAVGRCKAFRLRCRGAQSRELQTCTRYPDYLDKIKPNTPMDLSSVMSNLDANRQGRDRHCHSVPCAGSLYAETARQVQRSWRICQRREHGVGKCLQVRRVDVRAGWRLEYHVA